MTDISILDQLFPAAPPHAKTARRKLSGDPTGEHLTEHNGRSALPEISTRWASIYALELRGLTHAQIAEAMGMSVGGVGQITRDERYLEYRERHLAVLDQEFVAMKPLAFAALRNGLGSSDENTALRASEQWFKGAQFGGFSRSERPTTSLTAEDVARQLLGAQINVQVNVNTGEREG